MGLTGPKPDILLSDALLPWSTVTLNPAGGARIP